MDKATLTMLAHTLKGPGLSCLFAMLGTGEAMGPTELAEITGFTRKTISTGLKQLQLLRLAAPTGDRYNGWGLTNQGYQLSLDLNPEKPALPVDNSAGENGEGYLLPVRGVNFTPPVCSSSGSSSLKESLNTDTNKQLLLHKRDGSLLPIRGVIFTPPDNLVRMLTKKACFPNLATSAITAALERGDTEEAIEHQITEWLKWCASPYGKSIKHPGIFTAKKIKNGEAAPDLAEVDLPDDEEQIEWQT